ncbi:MAG: hypothetical protein RBS01_02135 [Candidatus Dojkabacteria bacterium]|jgi:hypothetical protein|nr:hypothetical protein [Candidatus Dojkabacteria bacterium]
MESLKDLLSKLTEKEKDSKVQKELFNTEEFSKKKVIINDKHKYISKEYQYYGLQLAGKLGDTKRVTMYIKWAKEKPRVILEQAYSFAIDYPHAKDRSRIFMWKVKELEKEGKKE